MIAGIIRRAALKKKAALGRKTQAIHKIAHKARMAAMFKTKRERAVKKASSTAITAVTAAKTA